jgi:hypothetical protein
MRAAPLSRRPAELAGTCLPPATGNPIRTDLHSRERQCPVLAQVGCSKMEEPLEADLKKARELIASHGSFVGPGKASPEDLAKLLAIALALGREQGLQIAANLIQRRRSAGRDE